MVQFEWSMSRTLSISSRFSNCLACVFFIVVFSDFFIFLLALAIQSFYFLKLLSHPLSLFPYLVSLARVLTILLLFKNNSSKISTQMQPFCFTDILFFLFSVLFLFWQLFNWVWLIHLVLFFYLALSRVFSSSGSFKRSFFCCCVCLLFIIVTLNPVLHTGSTIHFRTLSSWFIWTICWWFNLFLWFFFSQSYL